MKQPANLPLNQNQGPTVATILAEPRMQDVDVAVITRGDAIMRKDIPHPQIRLDGKKKVQFNVIVKKDTLFEPRDVIGINTSKLPVYEIPTAFYSTFVVGPL